jgi:hypothetical protein
MIALDTHAGETTDHFTAAGIVITLALPCQFRMDITQTLHRPFALRHGRCVTMSSRLPREPGDQVNSAWRLLRRDININ